MFSCFSFALTYCNTLFMSGVFGHSPTVMASYLSKMVFISVRNSTILGPLQYLNPACCHGESGSVMSASSISPLLYMLTVSTRKPSTPRCSPELYSRGVDGLPGLGVLPVEIRLLGAEEMEIVLLGVFVPLPDTAGEVAGPIIGRCTLAVHIAGRPPDVPVTLGIIFG